MTYNTMQVILVGGSLLKTGSVVAVYPLREEHMKLTRVHVIAESQVWTQAPLYDQLVLVHSQPVSSLVSQ